MKSWRLLALLVSIVAVTACDDDDDDNPVDPDRMTATEFVQEAAESDFFEIQSGQMAADNSTNTDVADYGSMLVMDHTMSSSELMSIAQKNNVTITTPTRQNLDDDEQERLTRLDNASAEQFDLEFVNIQIEAHEDAIELYQEAIQELENTELKAFAQSTLPILQEHLQEAQTLKTQLSTP